MSTQHSPLRARLEAKEKRPLDRAPAPIATAPPAPLTITRAHEVSALAVGLLVLRHVEETGRTRLQEQAIEDAVERVTKHLNAEQMMRLEVEAYEVVDWLVGEDKNDYAPRFIAEKEEDNTVLYDPSSSIPDIVRAAVAQTFDLSITYYSSRRMEMNRRVISPKAIAAEVYVRAWCHERRDERIFRMSRIRSAVPVEGRAIKNPHFEHAVSEQQTAQQSLELEHLSYDMLKGRHARPSKVSGTSTAQKTTTAQKAGAQTAPRAAKAEKSSRQSAKVSSQPKDSARTPASSKDVSTAKIAQASKSSEKGDAALVLQPTPTDSELLAMERDRKLAEEAEAAAKALQEAQDAAAKDDDDSQMSFF